MTNAQHTPGPWTIDKYGQVEAPDGRSIAINGVSSVCSPGPAQDVAKANARLMAAAYNSYDKHFGPNAIAAAEADLLGKALAALSKCLAILENERVVQAVTNEVEAGTEWFDVLDLVVAADEARAVLTKAGKDGQ